MQVGSILGLLDQLNLLHVIELFLVIFEWLRQDCVLRRRCRAIELLLHRLIHTLSMVDQMVLTILKSACTPLLRIEFVDEEHFVVLVFALIPLQVHLLDPHATIVHFLLSSHALVEGRLAIGHICGAFLNALPPLFQCLVFFL